MSFFRVIMPNYNNREWLEKSVGSVLKQTFTDYHLIFVDDKSTDDSMEKFGEIIRKIKTDARISWTIAIDKAWNGGARNLGIEYGILPEKESEYTLFLDSDDWLCDENILQDLHDFIVAKNMPDCVRLPYICRIGDEEIKIMLDDDTPDKLVRSCFVACWTKCIKTKLIPKFPENTLMEDVVQHIEQCDKIITVAPFTRPAVVWNRNNSNSCSREENQDCQHGKWQSSMYRYMADLLDLELEHDYCEEERGKRSKKCLENIREGLFIQ